MGEIKGMLKGWPFNWARTVNEGKGKHRSAFCRSLLVVGVGVHAISRS